MKNGYFPVDIHAVKEYGIDKWQQGFFWPVSDTDFNALCGDIEQCLARYINEQPAEIRDLLLIKSDLRTDYWHFLHAIKVIDTVKSEGGRVLYSDRTLWYKGLIEGGPGTAKMKQSLLRKSPANYTTRKKMEIAIKKYVKNK